MTYQVMDNGELRDATEAEIAEIEARMTIDLATLKAAAIAKTYTDVDGVYEAAIGRRATEYQEAEDAARAFAAAGYLGEVSEYVSDYATHNVTGAAQTNRWAADQIISRADAFRAAQAAMRSQRFQRQAEMRAASTPSELATAVAAWDGFIAALRGQLGL